MGGNKFVHLMFAAGGLLLAFLLAKTGDWVWGYFAKPKDVVINVAAVLLAGAAALVAWRNERVFGLAVEVMSELRKVTWPTRKETQAATLVVIVTVIVAAIFLGMFDAIWSWLTSLIYR
jgi:preprotein translocase subunit SecE